MTAGTDGENRKGELTVFCSLLEACLASGPVLSTVSAFAFSLCLIVDRIYQAPNTAPKYKMGIFWPSCLAGSKHEIPFILRASAII